MNSQRWEVEWGDMMPAGEDPDTGMGFGWIPTQKLQDLLDGGWEPFGVTLHSVYHPEDPPLDLLRERIWLRRLIDASGETQERPSWVWDDCSCDRTYHDECPDHGVYGAGLGPSGKRADSGETQEGGS